MYPVVLQIGSFQLRSYGVMAAVGFLLAAWILGANSRRAGISRDDASSLLFTAMVSGIVGARLFYVVQFSSQFRNNFWEIFRVDRGGLVFYGGFLLAIAALYCHCRIRKIDFIRALDLFAPAMAASHACGRIGCFLNGCCYGAPTDLPWGVVYPEGAFPRLRYGAMALHPAQLYEAAWNFAVCGLFLWLLRRTPRGVPMSIYLALYGAFRFINEFWRGDNPKVLLGCTPAQVIGLVLIPVGIALAFFFCRRGAAVHAAR